MTSLVQIRSYQTPQAPLVGFSLCDHSSARQLRRATQRACGRSLAALLLKEFGSPYSEVGKGERGQPLWPPHFFGSISHSSADSSRSYVLVLLGNGSGIAGVDIEPIHSDERLHRISHAVFTETERVLLQEELGVLGFVVGFSAKESLFKALYPLTNRWFWFPEATITSVSPNSLVIRVSEFARAGLPLPHSFHLYWEHLPSSGCLPAIVTWMFYRQLNSTSTPIGEVTLIDRAPKSLALVITQEGNYTNQREEKRVINLKVMA